MIPDTQRLVEKLINMKPISDDAHDLLETLVVLVPETLGEYHDEWDEVKGLLGQMGLKVVTTPDLRDRAQGVMDLIKAAFVCGVQSATRRHNDQ